MLSIRQAFRSSSRLSITNISGGILAVLTNILVARRLGPEALGLVGLVQLWQLYAGFARPGILQAGYREMLHLLGQGRNTEAKYVENISLTAECAALFIPVAVMAAAGLLVYNEPRLRFGMALAIAGFATNSLFNFADTVQWAHQNFALITRVNLLVKISQPLLILAGLYTFGVYGVLAAPSITSMLALSCYLHGESAVRLSPKWDAREVRRLMRIGFPIALYGLLYWGFRTSDRAMVARWLSISDLGYFTFAMTFITQGCSLVSDFLNVLQANLFAELGRVGSVRPLSHKLQRISLLIMLVTGAASGFALMLLHPMVVWFVPKFAPGIPAFEILVLNLVCSTVPLLAYTILISAVINRQDDCALIQFAGLALNVILGYTLFRFGLGLCGIAWSSALSQLAAASAAFAILHTRMFEGAPISEPRRFYTWAVGLLGSVFALHFAMSLGPFAYSISGRLLLPGVMRASATATFWIIAAFLLHRQWWATPEKNLPPFSASTPIHT